MNTKLIITIDTEEDNWDRYSTTVNPAKNIEKIVTLQKMFDRFGIKPTYLITYPVATDPRSIIILKKILMEGKCEIGMHCHPWNTPPFEEEINEVNSMLCNLSEALVHEKLKTLHQAICENFDTVPVSFRSGRWGFSSTVARSLIDLGYKVDTSVSPFIDWRGYHGPNFRDFPLHPYRFFPDDITTPRNNGSLLEVPATVGFLQRNFIRCQQITRVLETKTGKNLRVKGVLHYMGLLNKTWLSPEYGSLKNMIKLSENVEALGYPVLNMSFHSSSLQAGLSPFVRTLKDEKNFSEKIEKFAEFTREKKYKSFTLEAISKHN